MKKSVKVLGLVAIAGAFVGGAVYAVHKLTATTKKNYISPDKRKDTEDIESILSGKCKCGDGNCGDCNCGDECTCGDECDCEDCDCCDFGEIEDDDEESIGDFHIPSEENTETVESEEK